MRAIGYCRVSTDRQAEQGLGLSVQRKAITAWAKANGCTITAWRTDEGISGSNGLDTRPGLAGAFRELEAGHAEALIVYRLDRLARKLGSQITWIERLESRGRQVISVTEPDVGQDEMRVFVRQVLGAVAEYERATIVRRMADGRSLKAERGGYAYGAPAYGQQAVDRELAPVRAEVQVITRMREMRSGGMSLRQISDTLNSEGVTAKRGSCWYPQTVARVLAR